MTFAQEICNNGRDDDGDGKIDCYDNNCAVSTFCKDFYLGDTAKCEAIPPAFPDFSMALDFTSPDETTNHLSRIAIGDLNADGAPEIVTMNRYSRRLFILNGSDGSIQKEAVATININGSNVNWEPNWEVAIANIDKDQCGEIYFFGWMNPPGDNNEGYYIFAYDCDLNLIWHTAERLLNDPINYGLADFNNDGEVELYVKDAIYNAHTGVRLVKSSATSSNDWRRLNGGPVAVDMNNDDDLELVLGLAIYDVNLGNGTQDNGSLSLIKKHNRYFIRNEYNATSVADYNLDGNLDILASGSLDGHGKNTTVFFWDVHNDALLFYGDSIAGSFDVAACPAESGEFYKFGWRNGTGRLNIADLDGDGKLNVSYVSGKYLYALNEKLEPMPWSPKVVNEETSGHTGCTLFDFNGDGQSEIVYRDEKFLYIINGVDGEIHNQKSCVSRTNREYPIVADVDGDGQTEICVTCGTDDVEAYNKFCDLPYSRHSQVRVFKTGGDPWVPARRVWNQHGYFNVNVNDDLSIPIIQQKHHIVFSEGRCTEGEHRPLNSFLNQTPFLNRDGCPTYKSPNLAFVENSLTLNPPTCPDKDFTVSFQFTNKGDIGLNGTVPITFYSGDPTQAGAIKLNTVNVPLNNFQVDAVHSISGETVNGLGNPFTLYLVLNDNGTTVPTPIEMPNTNFLECDYGDNILSIEVDPGTVPLEATRILDNIKCTAIPSPDIGSAKAVVTLPGNVKNTTDFNFYWSEGQTPKPIPADHAGSTVNGLAAGVYSVFAVHKTANCRSAVDTVLIRNVERTITVEIELLSPFTNCENPDGALKAIVKDVDGDGVDEPEGDFLFEWSKGSGIITSKIGTNAEITGLDSSSYTVLVYEKLTGCPGSETDIVPSEIEPFVVDVETTDILCSSANSGSASASVNNSTTGYTFQWYRGSKPKPSADHSGADFNNLSAGSYTVVATQQASECKSEPVIAEVTQTTPVTVMITGSSNQTSCDVSEPNGTATATADGSSDITLYDFAWYAGQNTTGTPIATGPNANNLPAGIYTVLATRKESGCSASAEVTIQNGIVTHSLAVGSTNDLTDCRTPNGSITVTVSPDNASDYTFLWYNGSSVKSTPDYTDTDNTLSGLPIGTYTVKAIHKTKHCSSNEVTAEVLDNTPAILIEQNASVTQLPTSCNANNGRMEVLVSAPGNTSNGFVIKWFRNGQENAFTSDSAVFSSQRVDLFSGLYTIEAKNLENGCLATDTFPLPFADPHELVLVDKDDALTCNPQNEGRIEVKLTPTPTLVGGVPFSVNDYLIRIYSGKNTSGTLLAEVNGSTGISNGDNTANYEFSSLLPGHYMIVAVENNPQLSGCESVPVMVEILPYQIRPLIKLTSTVDNSNCASTDVNGRIEVQVHESNDPNGAPKNPADYTFAWSPNTTTVSNVAEDLEGGMYAVSVTNIATQCTSDPDSILIVDTPPFVSIVEDADLIVTDITRCDYPNGATARVQSVNGVPIPDSPAPSDYSFEWFDSDMNAWPNPGAPATGNSIIDLSAGTYFVRVTRTNGTPGLGCQSSLVEFEVEDKTPGTIVFDLESFVNPTRCKKNPNPSLPDNELGELEVTSKPEFTYQWYQGDDFATAQLLATETSSAISDIAMPNGETQLPLWVQVTNTTNACVDTAKYVLELDVAPVTITASASPVTSCLTNDGVLFASVTNTSSFEYTYNWYNGDDVKATPDYTPGKEVAGRGIGTYTVQAVDNLDNFCRSTPKTVVVNDRRSFPSVTAMALAALTVCDPQKLNGVATAHVNNNVSNYNFNWFEGEEAAGTPFYIGVEAGNLNALTYSVVAVHMVSGCSDTTSVSINRNTPVVPNPAVDVLSNVTSCIINNGALTAHVDGNTSGYIFHWYLSNPGTPADTTQQTFKGETFTDLAVGTYFASATDRFTGCISGPAEGSITEDPQYPDFNFIVEPASCDQANGLAAITLTTGVEVDSVFWTANGDVIKEGPILAQIEAGFYEVTVISNLGCATTKPVEVKTEIRPFNGISRNGDGLNEIFYIDCIGNFQQNLVKIFNRAGTLVYEAEGYDNTDTFFNGQSNKGVSLMGTNLPDGTYFYIIDKRDGSKPIAGYLEIVN